MLLDYYQDVKSARRRRAARLGRRSAGCSRRKSQLLSDHGLCDRECGPHDVQFFEQGQDGARYRGSLSVSERLIRGAGCLDKDEGLVGTNSSRAVRLPRIAGVSRSNQIRLASFSSSRATPAAWWAVNPAEHGQTANELLPVANQNEGRPVIGVRPGSRGGGTGCHANSPVRGA